MRVRVYIGKPHKVAYSKEKKKNNEVSKGKIRKNKKKN